MTAPILPFLFDGAALVRVIERGAAPWFVAKDVAAALGYADPPKAITSHCRRAVAIGEGVGVSPTLGGRSTTPLALDPQTKLIPEGDVFRLILRSRLPAAQRFETWVMEELLPAVRRGEARRGGALSAPSHATEALEGLKLRAVSEARKVFGPRAAGELWFALSLPRVAAMVLDARQGELLSGGEA